MDTLCLLAVSSRAQVRIQTYMSSHLSKPPRVRLGFDALSYAFMAAPKMVLSNTFSESIFSYESSYIDRAREYPDHLLVLSTLSRGICTYFRWRGRL